MESKNTVTLTDGGENREFSVEHAEGLLNSKIRGGSGWKLADPDWEVVDGSLHRKAKKETKEKK